MSERAWDPQTGLPFRVPGQPTNTVAVPRLSQEAFSRGLELLTGWVNVPRGPVLQEYFDMVRYELTEIDWLRAVRKTIREGNDGRTRMPSPATMIARAGVRPPAQEGDPYAGRWVFACAECGRRGMTAGTPAEPPKVCRECEKRRAWT
jgi:hypothetical protein